MDDGTPRPSPKTEAERERRRRKVADAIRGLPPKTRAKALARIGDEIGATEQVSAEDVAAGAVRPPQPWEPPRRMEDLVQRFLGDERFTDEDEDGNTRFDFAAARRHCEARHRREQDALNRHIRNKPAAEAAERLLGAFIEQHDADAIRLMDADDADIRQRAEDIAGIRNELLGRKASPRDVCPIHHRRQLRDRIKAANIHAASILGMAHKRRPFVSADCLRQHEQRIRRGRTWLEQQDIKAKSDGRRVPLSDVVDASQEARRSMLYALALGQQREAAARGYEMVMITMTLPPVFHACSKSFDPSLTPQDVRDALSTRWAEARKRINRAEARWFGFWVNEPHRDGTPHKHLLAFVHPDDKDTVAAKCREWFPDAGGGADVACDVKEFDPEGAAKASTYMMAYLQKLTRDDGGAGTENVVSIEVDEDHLAEQRAYDAWASGTRTHKHGFVGMRNRLLADWRRVYSLDRLPEGCDRLRAAKAAMNRKEWDAALRALDAFARDRDEREVESEWHAVYEEATNRYGETIRRLHTMITPGGVHLPYKDEEWEIVEATTPRKGSVSEIDSSPRDASPTRPEPPPARPSLADELRMGLAAGAETR